MTKYLVFGLFCLLALTQVSYAADLAEALNINIREQLNGYNQFLEQDDGSHKEDLQKLIGLTEGALKADTVDAKQAILKNIGDNFSPEFNKYITQKLNVYQANDDIKQSIALYKSLKPEATKFGDEIDKTVSVLEELLKETDAEKKLSGFVALDKNFSPEFQQYLRENSLPRINQQLEKTKEFLENVLQQTDVEFDDEIKQLIAEAKTALGDITIDEKQNALNQVTNPANRQLYEYLQKKYIELN